MLLMVVEIGLEYSKYPYKALQKSFIKIKHLEACQDPTYPPSQSLKSWMKGLFLMELDMVSWYSKYPRKALLKVSSRSNIRNLVKTLHFLKVSSWSLGGQLCS